MVGELRRAGSSGFENKMEREGGGGKWEGVVGDIRVV